jgi:hypothetical protein
MRMGWGRNPDYYGMRGIREILRKNRTLWSGIRQTRLWSLGNAELKTSDSRSSLFLDMYDSCVMGEVEWLQIMTSNCVSRAK